MITLMYALLIVSIGTEATLVAGVRYARQVTTVIAGFTLMFAGFAAGSLVIFRPSIATILLLLVTLARFINPLRFVEARMHHSELMRRSRRTWLIMGLITLVLIGYDGWLNDSFAVNSMLLFVLQLVVVTLLGVSVLLARTIYRYRARKKMLTALPTVSVCIPARNETQDLPACIESVIASTYPKLEIIVLDDCSHDKTPDIIKKYAHAGVRFVNGKEPREDWLAKNAAYDRLADEARGDILLFIGVDVRMEAHTITELVNQFDGDDMLSVLPKRSSESEGAFFIQPIRYWWELGLWRFVVSAPPVLSTCWLIRADVLRKLGTFESVKKAVEPEAVFARALAEQKKYAFLIANDSIGVSSKKAPYDQFMTALRKRYTQVRRRPEDVFGLILFESSVVLAPYVLFVHGIVVGNFVQTLLSAVTITILSLANAEVYKLSLRRLWPLGLFSMPILVVADIALLLRSMYAYEFGKVIWKERNICLPLLTVEKSLPKID